MKYRLPISGGICGSSRKIVCRLIAEFRRIQKNEDNNHRISSLISNKTAGMQQGDIIDDCEWPGDVCSVYYINICPDI